MKTLIFIGGATACGKSTLANNLHQNIPDSIIYRRYQGFFDIAELKKILNMKSSIVLHQLKLMIGL